MKFMKYSFVAKPARSILAVAGFLNVQVLDTSSNLCVVPKGVKVLSAPQLVKPNPLRLKPVRATLGVASVLVVHVLAMSSNLCVVPEG